MKKVESKRSKHNEGEGAKLVCDLCGNTSFQFLFNHHNNWSVQACKECGLNQVIPRPTRKEVAALYQDDAAHFSPYINQEQVHREYFHKKLSVVSSQLSGRKSQDISTKKTNRRPLTTDSSVHLLDVGCLTGLLVEEAEKLGMVATGIDISADAVAYCKKKGLHAFHGTIADFVKKNPSKRFDIITAMEVIEHEYSPHTLVSTMYSLLKPGGIAVVTTPNHGSNWRKVMGKYWPGYQHTEHLYFFDHSSLYLLFNNTGFKNIIVKRDENRPFPLSFLFTRAGDYVPVFGGILRFIGSMLQPFPIQNPINPWDDAIVIARK